MFCLSLNIAELNFINSIKRTTKKKNALWNKLEAPDSGKQEFETKQRETD